jgi:CRISPR-associated protein Cas6
MLWQEDDKKQAYVVPDDIIDIAFRINCKSLPLEHAHALSTALHEALPWLEQEEQAGIHLIHGAESGNGWMRPENPENELLYLSRRTRMMIRIPKERIADAEHLTGKTLDIAGYSLEVGESTVRPLTSTTILFSRYVIADENDDEEQFVSNALGLLKDMEITVRKLLCGKTHTFSTPEGNIFTRSLMLADMEVEDAVKLQQQGLGPGRKLGCGLFIPHKGIAAVKKAEED